MVKNVTYKRLIVLIVVITGCANPVHELDKLFALKATNWVFVNINVVDVEQGEIPNNRDGFGPWLWISGPILEGENKTHPLMSSFTDKVSTEKEVERQHKQC